MNGEAGGHMVWKIRIMRNVSWNIPNQNANPAAINPSNPIRPAQSSNLHLILSLFLSPPPTCLLFHLGRRSRKRDFPVVGHWTLLFGHWVIAPGFGGHGDVLGFPQEISGRVSVPESWWVLQREQSEQQVFRWVHGRGWEHGAHADWSWENQECADPHERHRRRPPGFRRGHSRRLSAAVWRWIQGNWIHSLLHLHG